MPRPETVRSAAQPAGADDSALVVRARGGDEAAFARLVERYGQMVLSLAFASTQNRAEAEDLAQETFLVAWRSLPRFRGDAAFSTWLYGLARSRCADRARRAAVRPRLARHAPAPVESAGSDPEGRHTARAILLVAARLPLVQRQAVLMRDVQGLAYEEIAALQDVPVGTVRSRIAAARRRIAEEVEER
ncbi:MAG TPA: sigma-70 family RNA polymerase sigma factor [Gaiellales bacterium]|jgi:RNA polymerase sigma-70 factor (ECF subfamily)|nr:sigma-70 family RNA polymerase sigma factor [Gaiellales bacterium]